MAILDNDDLKAIKNLMEVAIDEAIEENLFTKDIIGQLLTKSDFYKKIDEVIGKIKGIWFDKTLFTFPFNSSNSPRDGVVERSAFKPLISSLTKRTSVSTRCNRLSTLSKRSFISPRTPPTIFSIPSKIVSTASFSVATVTGSLGSCFEFISAILHGGLVILNNTKV